MTKQTLLLLAVLMLLLAACSGGGSTTTTDPNVLFQDDFSQTSSGWDRYTGDDAITDYNNGVYRMWVNSDNTDIWANPGLNFQDVRVEVKATKIAGPDDNDFGVICRYQDVENFYFMIVSSDGYYGIGAVEAGEQFADSLIGKGELRAVGKAASRVVRSTIPDGRPTRCPFLNSLGSHEVGRRL
jgi:hypothetical protein